MREAGDRSTWIPGSAPSVLFMPHCFPQCLQETGSQPVASWDKGWVHSQTIKCQAFPKYKTLLKTPLQSSRNGPACLETKITWSSAGWVNKHQHIGAPARASRGRTAQAPLTHLFPKRPDIYKGFWWCVSLFKPVLGSTRLECSTKGNSGSK